MGNVELEFVGSYRVLTLNEVRWRFRIKGTKVYINVSAPTFEEAVKKAIGMAKKIKLSIKSERKSLQETPELTS